MPQSKGASGKPDRATHEPSPQAVSAVPVGIPSAAKLAAIMALIDICERGQHDDLPKCIVDVGVVTDALSDRLGRFIDAGAWMDAAIALLPAGAVWRAYTDRSCTVYGASPYNAAAQEAFDGFSDVRPLALCAALLRMIAAPLLKAQAAEARRAGAK